MNARQTKKRLKSKIKNLQSDNNLMRRIIEDSPTMMELYDLYNKPQLNITTMQFQEFRVRRAIPFYMADCNGIVEHTKQELAKQLLFEGVDNYITYNVESEGNLTAITASIFVGRKRGINSEKIYL